MSLTVGFFTILSVGTIPIHSGQAEQDKDVLSQATGEASHHGFTATIIAQSLTFFSAVSGFLGTLMYLPAIRSRVEIHPSSRHGGLHGRQRPAQHCAHISLGDPEKKARQLHVPGAQFAHVNRDTGDHTHVCESGVETLLRTNPLGALHAQCQMPQPFAC